MTDQTKPEPTDDKPTPQPAAPGTAPDSQAGEAQPQAKTFTQDQVNEFLRGRLEEHTASLLKKLGVTSIDEGKSAVTKAKELEDANKTELEKLTTRLSTAEQRATEAEQKRRIALIKAAVIAEASKPGKVAGDRLEAAYKLLDSSKLTVKDNDEVEGVADAIVALLEVHPFLKADETKPAPQPEKPKGTVQPTNPAGTSGEPDLSWHPLKRSNKNAFGAPRVFVNTKTNEE